MAVFVLVHGGFHGGWRWKKVVPYLRNNGHKVYTPTLTGLGERSHLATPDIGLDTYIMDVVNVLQRRLLWRSGTIHLLYEDLQNVVLVGHSFCGIVITGVAETMPERLDKLVYLDAFAPNNGQSFYDLIDNSAVEYFEKAVQKNGFLKWSDLTDLEQPFGVSDPSDIAWIKSKMTPQPGKCCRQAVKFTKKAALDIPKVYIRCTKNPVRYNDVC